MFCVVCGSELREVPVVDVLIKRLVCSSGHLFYQPTESQAGRIPDPLRIKNAPATGGDRRLIEFWLSDRDARREVPPQLAEVCRRLLEFDTHNEQLLTEASYDKPDRVRFCFACGSRAVCIPNPEGWETAYRCEQRHELFARGGYIRLGPPAPTEIIAEPATSWMAKMADHWVSDDKHAAPYIASGLREAIRRLRPLLGSS